jgi:hypothetical protein
MLAFNTWTEGAAKAAGIDNNTIDVDMQITPPKAKKARVGLVIRL